MSSFPSARGRTSRFLGLWIMGVAASSLLGCNDADGSATSEEGSPCDDELCSDHGQCAVAAGEMAVCLCDPGYHSGEAGLACVANVIGDECAGVDCNAGGICAVSSGEPICVCAGGFHAMGPTACLPDDTAVPASSGTGCLSSADCDPEQVCQRLSGTCVALADVICGVGADESVGSQPVGGACLVGSPEETAGCSALDAGVFCEAGLRCTPTSPLPPRREVCWDGEARWGVCRGACDLCEVDSCGEGESCGDVPGLHGVCMPTGYSAWRCGYPLCQPGWTCSFVGMPGDLAAGECSLRCDPEHPMCPGGMLCSGLGDCRVGHFVEAGDECNQSPDAGICRAGHGCAYNGAIGWRCVAL